MELHLFDLISSSDILLDQIGCSVLANPEPFCRGQGAKLETFCDEDWWESQVVERLNDRVRIHYVGGEEDEDEWIPISSARLRPPQDDNKVGSSMNISESHHLDCYESREVLDQRPVRRSRLTLNDARLALRLQKEEVKAARGKFPATRKRIRPETPRPIQESNKRSASCAKITKDPAENVLSKDDMLGHLSGTKASRPFNPSVTDSFLPYFPSCGNSTSSQRLNATWKASASNKTNSSQKLNRADNHRLQDQIGMVSFMVYPGDAKDHVLPPLKTSRMCLTEDFTICQVKRLIIDEIQPDLCTTKIELRTPCGALVGQDHTLKYVRAVQWPKSRGDLVLQYNFTRNKML
jgi:hypothetical protein